MPETYVHVQDKNREISPLGREEGYGGKTRKVQKLEADSECNTYYVM